MALIVQLPYISTDEDHHGSKIKHPDFVWHEILSISSTNYDEDISRTRTKSSIKTLNPKCLQDLLTISPKAKEARKYADITDLINKFVVDYNYTFDGSEIIRCTCCSSFHNASYKASVSMNHFYDNVYEMYIDVDDYKYESHLNVSSKFIIIVINERCYTITNELYNWLNDSTKPKKLAVLQELVY